ncbi:MAG: hypothetical protein H7305_04900 [Gemmatimonadaceae bacterium]|nr:hypothetical protein [Gemmatimonadaceae bacterium]
MDTQGTGTDIVVFSALRTPFRAFGDSLHHVVAAELAVSLKIALAGRQLRSNQSQTMNLHAGSHPRVASGARIASRFPHALQSARKYYAPGASCIGGSQGGAVVLEALA